MIRPRLPSGLVVASAVLLGGFACSSPAVSPSAAHPAHAAVEGVAEVDAPPPREVEGDPPDEVEDEVPPDDELTGEDLEACVPYESLAEVCQDMDIPAAACHGTAVAEPSHGFDEILLVHHEVEEDIGSGLSNETRTRELLVLRMGSNFWLAVATHGHYGGGYEFETESVHVSVLPEGLAVFVENTEGSTEPVSGWTDTGTSMVLVTGVHGAPRRRLAQRREVAVGEFQRHPLGARTRAALPDCSATRCEPVCWLNDPFEPSDSG